MRHNYHSSSFHVLVAIIIFQNFTEAEAIGSYIPLLAKVTGRHSLNALGGLILHSYRT